MMNVTRDVIRDLWALREAGDASQDSRHLVDQFLAEHPDLAAELSKEPPVLGPAVPDLPPGHEAKTLSRMKKRLNRRSPLRLIALAFTGLSIARLIEHTTFTQSPTEVIGLAIAAVIAWIANGWHMRYLQRQAVFGPSADAPRRATMSKP
jgi:hypothetical protein